MITVSGSRAGRISVAGLVCLKPGARGHLLYRVRIHRRRKGERRSLSEADYAGLITVGPNSWTDSWPKPDLPSYLNRPRRQTPAFQGL